MIDKSRNIRYNKFINIVYKEAERISIALYCGSVSEMNIEIIGCIFFAICMSGVYILHMYTKEKLIKRKNAVYLILAFFQINTGYHMVVKKIYEQNLFANPWYLTALILYILTQILLIVTCVKTKNGA
jgi:predicted tellurium resistance membrane protein TerC